MGNSLGKELENKYVIIKNIYIKTNEDISTRIFFCTGGFGCSPITMGRCLGGYFIKDKNLSEKEKYSRLDSYDVERFATEEEIQKYTL